MFRKRLQIFPIIFFKINEKMGANEWEKLRKFNIFTFFISYLLHDNMIHTLYAAYLCIVFGTIKHILFYIFYIPVKYEIRKEHDYLRKI